MTQRDNYIDLSGAQAIFQQAINPDVPTQTGPILLKWRGVWTPGSLYNKNDLAKVPTAGPAGTSTLEIALETHVAGLVFADDSDLWGRVLDASELSGSGIPPDELQAYVDAAAASASQASGAATTAAGQAARAQGISDGMTTNINTALDEIDSSVGEAEAIRDDTSLLSSQASGFADDAAQAKTGAETAAQTALGYLVTTAIQPYMYIVDPAGAGAFTISPDDTWKGRKVIFMNAARDCNLVLPANWNRTKWVDGTDGAAWFRGKRIGAGALAISGGVAGVINPDFIIDDHFSARQTGVTGTTTILRSLSVPAGTGRWVVYQGFSLYETTDLARNVVVTAQVRGGAVITMTKLQGPLTTNPYNATGGQAVGTMYIGQIPDAAPASIIDVTIVYPLQVFLFDQYIFIGGPAAGFNATTVGYTEPATVGNFADIALTVATGKANSLAVLGYAQRQGQLPTSLTPGTQRFAGLAPADPGGVAGRNNSTVFGYDKNLSVGARSWRATWAAGARHAALGVLLEPGSGASPVVLRVDPGITIATVAAGKEFLVEGISDGLTYDIT
jgi:hypothetical protein